MPDLFEIAHEAGSVLAQATATNAECLATVVVSSAQRAHIMGVLISANGAPAAGKSAEYRVAGVTAFEIQLPAAAHFPIFVPFTTRGLLHGVGDDIAFSVPAYNVGIKVSVQIIGHLVSK
jgi:hypothetical protein